MWTKKYEQLFIRDAIAVSKYFVITAEDSNEDQQLMVLSNTGSILERDLIANYTDVYFWGERLIFLEEGFALTGTRGMEPLPQPVVLNEEEPVPAEPPATTTTPEQGLDAKVLYFSWKFEITSETDGNGSIDVIQYAQADDEITFDVLPNPGYELKSLTVTSKSGETITYEEDELKYNEDGTVSVSINKFTMPDDDVHIIAHFEKTEPVPDTSDNIMLYVTMLIGGIAVFGTIIYRRNHT